MLSCWSSKPGPQSIEREEVRGAGERGENSWYYDDDNRDDDGTDDGDDDDDDDDGHDDYDE